MSDADPIAAIAAGVCKHMNEDHADALALYCEVFGGHPAERPRMVSVDAAGFDVVDEASGRRYRFDFPARVSTSEDLRKAVVVMAREARARRDAK